MSRLLFAAARGARLEYRAAIAGEPDWMPLEHLPMSEWDGYRIHPDDEHLQYGPISTALREAAAAGNAWDLTGPMGRAADAVASYNAVWWYLPKHERSLFLLILAEALADEGL